MTLVNQHSKQFKEEPTIENKDWRGAQLILETFLLDCGLQLTENARRGISAGLTVIPSTNCFKLACDQIGVEDIKVVKPSKRKKYAANVMSHLLEDARTFKLVVHQGDGAWRQELPGLLTHLTRFYNLTNKFDDPNGEYQVYDCSCPRFRMTAKCKHAVAAGIFQGKISVPVEMSLRAIKTQAKSRPT